MNDKLGMIPIRLRYREVYFPIPANKPDAGLLFRVDCFSPVSYCFFYKGGIPVPGISRLPAAIAPDVFSFSGGLSCRLANGSSILLIIPAGQGRKIVR
jgi:hypothetical protein